MDPLSRKLGKWKIQFTISDPRSPRILLVPASQVKNLKGEVCMDRLHRGRSSDLKDCLGCAGKLDSTYKEK